MKTAKPKKKPQNVDVYKRQGDILFFTDKDSETGEMIDFAGIYTGNGQLIYSPYPGEKVKFADLNSSYWQTLPFHPATGCK